MKMHNNPYSWTDLFELLQGWWRGETPMGAVLMAIIMATLRIAYTGGDWEDDFRGITMWCADANFCLFAGISGMA